MMHPAEIVLSFLWKLLSTCGFPNREDDLMTMAVEEGQNTRSECIQKQPERRAKSIATIQSWAVVDTVVSQSFAALRAGNRLIGHVLGLPRLPYAKLAYTSPIVKVNPTRGLVETRNTIYRLGEISEAYASWRGMRR